MRLTLTGDCPWKSQYLNDAGQVVYDVSFPYALINRTATIRKVVELGSTTFQTFATVEFHSMSPTIFKFNGLAQPIESTDLFETSAGAGWLIGFGSDRIFTAPDGKRYKWMLNSTKVECYLAEGSKALVAKYHRPHGGFFSNPQPASFEIFPPGDDVPDVILTTFIYMEKLRADREMRRRRAGRG